MLCFPNIIISIICLIIFYNSKDVRFGIIGLLNLVSAILILIKE